MNCYREYGPAPRRGSSQVNVGHVVIGGAAPIVVQSMTNTDTADVPATVKQVAELARAGSALRIAGMPPLTIVVGNSQGVKMTYAGKAVDLARHTKFEVARLTLE